MTAINSCVLKTFWNSTFTEMVAWVKYMYLYVEVKVRAENISEK